MNIFRLLGDLSHLASILILLHKIVTSRSCRGTLASGIDARYLVQDADAVLYCVCDALYLPVPPSQYLPDSYEVILYWQHRVHLIPHQGAIQVRIQALTAGLVMKRISIRSAWNGYWAGLPFWRSSSTTNSRSRKSCGRTVSSSRPWPFCRKCSCCSALARQKRSPRTIFLLWVPTVLCTSSTGSTGM